MEGKALLTIALWFFVETRAASVGKEPAPWKEGGEVGCGQGGGVAERTWRPDLTRNPTAEEVKVT